MNLNTVQQYMVIILLAMILAVVINGQRGELERIRNFMEAGPRFAAHYGLGLCERIKLLEEKSGRKDTVDCDGMRHAILGTRR